MRKERGHFLDLVGGGVPLTWNNGNADCDIPASTEAQKNADVGVVVELFPRDHASLLTEGFVLLRALEVVDLDRWVSALRRGRLPAAG